MWIIHVGSCWGFQSSMGICWVPPQGRNWFQQVAGCKRCVCVCVLVCPRRGLSTHRARPSKGQGSRLGLDESLALVDGKACDDWRGGDGCLLHMWLHRILQRHEWRQFRQFPSCCKRTCSSSFFQEIASDCCGSQDATCSRCQAWFRAWSSSSAWSQPIGGHGTMTSHRKVCSLYS